MKSLKSSQQGVSLTGLIMVAFVLIFVAILGMKLVPAYLHSQQISQIFKDISRDSMMLNAPAKDIKESFSKRANINYITDMSPEDIDINKEDGKLILSANYFVKIPLVANITLLLEFNPSSS